MKKTTFELSMNNQAVCALSVEVLNKLSVEADMNVVRLKKFVFKNKKVKELFKFLGIAPKNTTRYLKAFTHSSFGNQFRHLNLDNFEKLEFLGDSVIGLIISCYIYKKFPHLNEGDLSKLRGAIVNEESLCKMASFLNLQDFILVGKGELKNGVNHNKSILADMFESLWGAVFLDCGFKKTTQLFSKFLEKYNHFLGREFISPNLLDTFDFKTQLQEITLKLFKTLPEYRVKRTQDASYQVELVIGDLVLATGEALSRKKAEQKLAEKVLREKLYLYPTHLKI